jgi:hypothetical protein
MLGILLIAVAAAVGSNFDEFLAALGFTLLNIWGALVSLGGWFMFS